MKYTVIVNGANPQTIIVIIANKASSMFRIVFQYNPLFMTVSDSSVKAK
jgi:hypothetical protein